MFEYAGEKIRLTLSYSLPSSWGRNLESCFSSKFLLSKSYTLALRRKLKVFEEGSRVVRSVEEAEVDVTRSGHQLNFVLLAFYTPGSV